MQCKIEDCNNEKRNRGWCLMHYTRYKRHGDPNICLRQRGIEHCQVPDCVYNTSKITLGYCNTHYLRFNRHGDINYTQSPNRSHGEPISEFFWSKVAITANPDKCWPWQGDTGKNGYGRLTHQSKRYLAHRFVLYLIYNKFPTKFVLHSCDNPSCVNPKHLREGTHLDNMQDAQSRGRHAHGERAGTVKLSTQDVLDIKRQISEGVLMKKEIAKMYNVSPSRISEIDHNNTWKHLI